MNDNDLETRLSALKITPPSSGYLDRGLALLYQESNSKGFWQRYLPVVLASALVVSVSANVFQMISNRHALETLESQQVAQCNTPAAAVSPVHDQFPGVEIATRGEAPQPVGMC